MSESNAGIIRKAYSDFARGDVPAVLAVLDAAITLHVPGHSQIAGDYVGHEQIQGFFHHLVELSGGTFRLDVHNVLAGDDIVVVLATTHAQRNGLSASFREVHVWRMTNGKASEFCEYQGDEQREDRFWS